MFDKFQSAVHFNTIMTNCTADVGNIFQHYPEEEKVVNCYIICVMQGDGVVNLGDG